MDSIEEIMRENVEYCKISTSIFGKDIVIIFLYRSKKYLERQFKSDLDMLVSEHENVRNIIILGDSNEEALLIEKGYDQIIMEPTTRERTRIDQAYVKLKDFNAEGLVLYKCFEESYHHPICVCITSMQ